MPLNESKVQSPRAGRRLTLDFGLWALDFPLRIRIPPKFRRSAGARHRCCTRHGPGNPGATSDATGKKTRAVEPPLRGAQGRAREAGDKDRGPGNAECEA